MTGELAHPSVTTYKVPDLVDQVWAGDIRVPIVQRNLRWTGPDVIRLFDSIVRGYPIGSLLLWVRPAPQRTIRFGALSMSTPKRDRALWVVEGQQRVTALANALHDMGGEDPRFAVSYDLRNARLTQRGSRQDAWALPLPALFDLRRLVAWFRDHPELSDDYIEQATDVGKAIRQYTVPAYRLEDADEAVLRDIVDRMDTYGKRRPRDEVLATLPAGDAADGPEPLGSGSIIRHIDENLGFGRIDETVGSVLLLAQQVMDLRQKSPGELDEELSDRNGLSAGSRDAAYDAGEQTLVRAVRFLQNVAGVPHFELVAYPDLFVVLTHVFARHPEPDSRNLQLLRRWYWRAAVLGPEIYRGDSTSGTTGLLHTNVPLDDASRSVQQLLRSVQHREHATPSIERFPTDAAATKIILCQWWHRGPRSPVTGEPYERAHLAGVLTDPGTPADAVRSIVGHRGVPDEYRFSAAPRAFILDEALPVDEIDGYLYRQPAGVDEVTWQETLHSHGLTPEMAEMFLAGDLARFLETRQHALRANLDDFLGRMCEWDLEDTPPLDDLVVEDLDDEDRDDAS